MRKSVFLILTAMFCISSQITAQNAPISHEATLEGYTLNELSTPFWLKNNLYGNAPLKGISLGLNWKSEKKYNIEHLLLNGGEKPKNNYNYDFDENAYDWGGAVEMRGNFSANDYQLKLIQAYAKVKLDKFEIKLGRSRDIMGYVGDSSLSSGSFAVSGNALGIPKISLGTYDFYSVPFTDDFFAVKANIAHGFLGNTQVNVDDSIKEVNTNFHQASLYLRFGKPTSVLNFIAGMNHQTFWGHEKDVYGTGAEMSFLEGFWRAAIANGFDVSSSNGKESHSYIGNHLGTIDVAAEVKLPETIIRLYKQNFYDMGGLFKLANIADGLYGIAYINQKEPGTTTSCRKIVIEVLNSKNQAGGPNAPANISFAENYYNHHLYTNGWSYGGQVLGNPFLSMKKDVKNGQVSYPKESFINNRVFMLHLGTELMMGDWTIKTKLSYSDNLGTYSTSATGLRVNGITRLPTAGIFNRVNQFSGYISAERSFDDKYLIGIVGGMDSGDLLDNSSGLGMSLKILF